MKRVEGLDVSYWNEYIDWHSVYEQGYRFAFVKATEGQAYKDPTFSRNWREAKQAGFLRGAYHFFHPAMDAEAQAASFIRQVNATKDLGELPPALDLETTDGRPNSVLVAGAKIWVQRIADAFGRAPILYSRAYFLRDHVSLYGQMPSWAKELWLWLADYSGTCDSEKQPFLLPGWERWAFWQYTKKGKIAGIHGDVDINCFDGTLETLHQFASGEMPEPVLHTVREGDTLADIADRYKVTVESIVASNPHILQSGTTLRIPVEEADEGGDAPSHTTYIVQPGDSLYAIAQRFRVTPEAIAEANHIENPNLIQVGQELIIPNSDKIS